MTILWGCVPIITFYLIRFKIAWIKVKFTVRKTLNQCTFIEMIQVSSGGETWFEFEIYTLVENLARNLVKCTKNQSAAAAEGRILLAFQSVSQC